MKKRYLEKAVIEDLKTKMVFLGGPRQVGKTTFSLAIIKTEQLNHPAYLNWDEPGVSKKLIQGILPLDQKIVIFDEIHKYAKWRNLVKGLYDTRKDKTNFIVTGSARLDYYRKGGDSLLGRYHYYRLHPLSLAEISDKYSSLDLERLLRFGGFPEPYFKGNETFHRRWQKERVTRVIREDLRDLEQVKMISDIEILAETLSTKVGSPLSIKSLREDLLKDHKTIENWVSILENLYYCFRIAPYGAPKIRALKKEQKLYLWDWSEVENEGARFENLVASQLLKYCHLLEDTEGYKMELRYIRDTDKREVDFVVLKNKKPLFAVECKKSDTSLSPALKYFKDRTDIPEFYQVHLGDKSYSKDGISVLPFTDFCKKLKMP